MKLLKNENINFQINNAIHSNIKTPHRIFIKKNKTEIKYKFLNNEFFKNITKIKINCLKFNFNLLKLNFFYQLNFNINQNKHFLFKNLSNIENVIEKFFYVILNFLNLFSFLNLNLVDKNNFFLFLNLNYKFFDKKRFKKVTNFYITNKKEKLRNNLKKNDKLFLTYYSIPYAFSNLGKEILYESSQTENFSFIGEKFNFKKQFFYFYNLRLYNIDELKESKEEVRKFFFNIPFHHLTFKALPFIVAEKNHNLFFKYNRKANLRLKFRENQLNSLINVSYTINFFKSLFLFKKRQLQLIFKKINQKTYQFNKKSIFHNRLKKIHYENNDLKKFTKKNLVTFYTLCKFLDKTKFYLKTYFTKLSRLNIEKNKISILSKFLNFKKTNFYYRKFETSIVNKNLVYFKRKTFLAKKKKFSFFKNNLVVLKKIINLKKKKLKNTNFLTKKNKFTKLKLYNKQLQKFTFFSQNYLKNYLLSDEKNTKNVFFFKYKKKKIKQLIKKFNKKKFNNNLKLNFQKNKKIKKQLIDLNFILNHFIITLNNKNNQKFNLNKSLFSKFFFKKSKKENIFAYLLKFIFTYRKEFERNFVNFNFKFLKLIKKIVKNFSKCQKLFFSNRLILKNKLKSYKNYFKFFNFLNNFKLKNLNKKQFKIKFKNYFNQKKYRKKIRKISKIITERKKFKKLGKKNLINKKKRKKFIKKFNLNRLNFGANNKLLINLINQKKYHFIKLKEKKIFFKLKKILNSFDLLINFYLNNILLCKSPNEYDNKIFSQSFKEKFSVFFSKKFLILKKQLNLIKKLIKNNIKFKIILKIIFKQINFLTKNLNFYRLNYLLNPIYFFKKQIADFKLKKNNNKIKIENKLKFLKMLLLILIKKKKKIKFKNKKNVLNLKIKKIFFIFKKEYQNLIYLNKLNKKTLSKYRKKLFYLYFITFLKTKVNLILKKKVKKKLFQKSKIILDFKEDDLFDYVEDQVYYEIQTLSFIKKNLKTILLYNNKLLHLKNDINLHD